MDIKQEDIEQYKQLCKRHFDQELTNGEARIKLADLVAHMEIVYRPVTTQQIYEQVVHSIKEELANDNH